MANYAVRIYDPALKAWLIAEAARRGPGVRTSDVVESALQLLKASLGGSDAPVAEIQTPPAESVHDGDAPNRAAAPADAVSRETVVPPVPAVDPDEGLVEVPGVTTLRVTDKQPGRILYPEHEFRSTPEPVARVKGPDSGPDDELGF